MGGVGRVVTSVSGPPSDEAIWASSHGLDEAAPGLEPTDQVDGDERAAHRHLPLGQLVLRVRREARVADARRPPGGPRGARPARSAVSLWRATRTGSVRMPRSAVEGVERRRAGALQHGEGPDGVDQLAARRRPRRAWRRCGRRCPWWPSAARGRRRGAAAAGGSGVANVESTTVNGPCDGAELVEVDQRELRVGRRLGEHQHGPARDAPRRRTRRARCRRRT